MKETKSNKGYIVGIVIVAVLIVGALLIGLIGKFGDSGIRKAKFTTSKGDVVIEVFEDRMPITSARFIELVESGFFKDKTFHRVEEWVIQAGMEETPKYEGIEFENDEELLNRRGMVGMARAGDSFNSATTEFYIIKRDAKSIDGQYAVFGRVRTGMAVVDKIVADDVITNCEMID